MIGGETFFFRGPENTRPHLWVIVSDPEREPERVVIVSMTTWKEYKDETCILTPDDHPALTHATSIDYGRARLFTASQLEKARDLGALDPQVPVSAEVLSRIRDGGVQSEFTPIKHRQVLLDQGFGED